MKRIFILILTFTLAFSLVSCKEPSVDSPTTASPSNDNAATNQSAGIPAADESMQADTETAIETETTIPEDTGSPADELMVQATAASLEELWTTTFDDPEKAVELYCDKPLVLTGSVNESNGVELIMKHSVDTGSGFKMILVSVTLPKEEMADLPDAGSDQNITVVGTMVSSGNDGDLSNGCFYYTMSEAYLVKDAQ